MTDVLTASDDELAIAGDAFVAGYLSGLLDLQPGSTVR
jgi:hypothetical protein